MWLLEARFIRQVFYPDWVANPVIVQEKKKQWCMYVDFIDLNNACPKDLFFLLRIDQIMDSTSRCITI